MTRTMKNDWLNNFLAQIQGMIVSDHLSFSNMMSLTEKEKASLRFVANRREVYAYILTIQTDIQEWNRVKKTLVNTSNFSDLMRTLHSIFNYAIPVLLYDDNYPNNFSVSFDLKQFRDVDDTRLHSYFTKLNSSMTIEPGNINKQINRTTNDSFQDWTRTYLSRYVTVNDFDALLLVSPTSQHPMVFELKRVQENVTIWEPYIDDQANYAASLRICQDINAEFRTISYQINRNNLVGLHTIVAADRDKVDGRMITCHPNDILHPPTNIVPRTYRSTRRRQR